MLIFGFCPPLLPEIMIFFERGNSLSQSLTVLTAPSGREPLARAQAFRFSRKLCRYAKGPILEGAVERSETGGVFTRKMTRNPIFQRTYVNKLRVSKNCKIF